MTIGSICSGVGGIDYALEQCNPPFEIAFQVENNAYCRKVLDRHWPEVPKFSDVTDLDGAELPQADIVVAGFPCQPFSLASSKRKGAEDERFIWDDIWRVTLEVGCRGLLLENVPAILHNGEAMSRILSDLARHGWSCQWDCLSCTQVGGLHQRKRWFCWCYPDMADTDREGLEGRGILRERPDQRATRSSRMGSPNDATRFFQGAIGGKWPSEADSGVLRISSRSTNRVHRIKAIGNSVCVPLVTWIGNRIHVFFQQQEKQWLTAKKTKSE